MAATDLLGSMFRLYFAKLSKNERVLLETILFVYLYQELIECYEAENNYKMENSMISGPVIRGIVNDLLVNNEYSVQGIANYTGYPEDVIYELAAGMNTNPTLILSTKIVELHAIARRDFYSELIKKVVIKLTSTAG